MTMKHFVLAIFSTCCFLPMWTESLSAQDEEKQEGNRRQRAGQRLQQDEGQKQEEGQQRGQGGQQRQRQRNGGGLNPASAGARANPASILRIAKQLELSNEQMEQLQAIVKETFPEFAARRDESQQRDPEMQAKRQAAVEKFRAEGLEGQELRAAVMKELGITSPTAEQRREQMEKRKLETEQKQSDSAKTDPTARRQEMQAKQKEMMEKIRDVLTPDQMESLKTKMKEQMERQQMQQRRGENGPGNGQVDRQRNGQNGAEGAKKRGGQREGQNQGDNGNGKGGKRDGGSGGGIS